LSSTYGTIQEGTVAVHLSLRGELDVTEVVEEVLQLLGIHGGGS